MRSHTGGGIETVALNGVFEAFGAYLPLFLYAVILQGEMSQKRRPAPVRIEC